MIFLSHPICVKWNKSKIKLYNKSKKEIKTFF